MEKTNQAAVIKLGPLAIMAIKTGRGVDPGVGSLDPLEICRRRSEYVLTPSPPPKKIHILSFKTVVG